MDAYSFLNWASLKRTSLYVGQSFCTAIDGESGDWFPSSISNLNSPTGIGQNYWNQTPDGIYHLDSNGVVMDQVIFGLDSDCDYAVQKEIQFVLNSKNQLFPKYILTYTGCKFCPAILSDGSNIRSSQGVAKWCQFDENGTLINGPTNIPWTYDVILNSNGQLDEYYTQDGKLAYWKRTIMAVNKGDISLEDVLKGTVAKQ